MVPEIITRSFSNDQSTFDKVFFNNCYNLKGHKKPEKIVVDIGAHAGYFSFLALTLCAKKVYAFEPYIDNFNILLKNCYNPNFIGRFTPYQVGVVTMLDSQINKFTSPEFVDNIYFDFASIGLLKKPEDNYYPCRCETLDDILEYYCFNEQIDILKINIGYAEIQILSDSILIKNNVKSLCGEITANENQLLEFKRTMGIMGFINFYSTEPNDSERLKFWASKENLSDNFVNIK